VRPRNDTTLIFVFFVRCPLPIIHNPSTYVLLSANQSRGISINGSKSAAVPCVSISARQAIKHLFPRLGTAEHPQRNCLFGLHTAIIRERCGRSIDHQICGLLTQTRRGASVVGTRRSEIPTCGTIKLARCGACNDMIVKNMSRRHGNMLRWGYSR
jgi:hypothetical protein